MLQIVTATLGSARRPVLRTAITSRSFPASDCLAANDAVGTATLKLAPAGVVVAAAEVLWRDPLPHPAAASAAPAIATQILALRPRNAGRTLTVGIGRRRTHAAPGGGVRRAR